MGWKLKHNVYFFIHCFFVASASLLLLTGCILSVRKFFLVFFVMLLSMVLKLDGYSEIGVHIMDHFLLSEMLKAFQLIDISHKLIFFLLFFLHAFATSSELPSKPTLTAAWEQFQGRISIRSLFLGFAKIMIFEKKFSTEARPLMKKNKNYLSYFLTYFKLVHFFS